MIYTHSGLFHGDDVFAVAAAKLMGTWGEEVVRVRELPVQFNAQQNDIALDVGGVHNPSVDMFDHHQVGGQDDGLAAIGKFWKYHGKVFLDTDLADRVWEVLLKSINDADIGVADWKPANQESRHVSASALISMMNADSADGSDMAFEKAVEFAEIVLKNTIKQAKLFVEMRNAVKSGEYHFHDHVLVLDRPGPWQEHVLSNEALEDLIYVIYPSDRGGYMIQAVPDKLGSFGTRKSFPKHWRGLRGNELKFAIESSIDMDDGPELFCHPGGFIAGAATQEEALNMAYEAL